MQKSNQSFIWTHLNQFGNSTVAQTVIRQQNRADRKRPVFVPKYIVRKAKTA